MELRDNTLEEKNKANILLMELETKLEDDRQRIVTIQDEIETISRDGGSESAELRMDYAIKQSELTSSRRELHEYLMTSLPFVIAGVPGNLSEWEIEDALDSKKSEEKLQENMNFLNSVIEDSGVGSTTKTKLLDSGKAISESSISNLEVGFLSNWNCLI